MNDGPTEVSAVLARLELLVAYVNASAGRPGVRPFVERRRRTDPGLEDASSD